MHERRNFLMAASTTLIGVGFAGLIASLIALATIPKGFRHQWGWVPVLGIFLAVAAILASVGLAIAWEVMWRRNRRRIRELNDWARRGSVIRQHMWIAVDWPQLQGAIFENAAWGHALIDWFHEQLPDYSGYFMNVGGQSEGSDSFAGLTNLISLRREAISGVDVQLQRIAEVVMRL